MKDKYQLARWMHEQYEAIAKSEGWETQEISRVDFDNLPESNRITMITLAERTISLLKAESEIVTSGADSKNGTYESVTKTECVADSTDTVQHTRGEALPKRIDDEKICCDSITWNIRGFKLGQLCDCEYGYCKAKL